jgi:hypothetical protein
LSVTFYLQPADQQLGGGREHLVSDGVFQPLPSVGRLLLAVVPHFADLLLAGFHVRALVGVLVFDAKNGIHKVKIYIAKSLSQYLFIYVSCGVRDKRKE